MKIHSGLLVLLAAIAAACYGGIDAPRSKQPKWTGVTLGLFHTCGAFDNTVYCFGDDRTGQLGTRSVGDSSCNANGLVNPCRPRPAAIAGHAFVLVGSGRMATCAVDLDGTWCWGSGTLGPTRADAPVRVTDRRFVALATMGVQMCGLAPVGEVYCWSGNVSPSPPALTLVNETVPLVSLTGSYNHLCGLTSSGDAYCWGLNSHGELAVGDTLPRASPTHVAGDLKFTSLSAGFARTCGIATDHHAYCSGTPFWTWTPQPDDSLNSTSFARVPGSDVFTTVSVGGEVACAVTVLREAKCWGANGNRLLGIGSAGGVTATPLKVVGD